jgi:hypothetical protein
VKAFLARKRLQGALLSAFAVLALANPSIAKADTVTQWNEIASNALFPVQDGRVAFVHLALVHGAVYDAVNAIDGGHEGYLLASRLAQPEDSKEAAAASAAFNVLVSILPDQRSTFEAQYAASLASIPDGTSKERGIAVGEAAAAAMIAARTEDGRFGEFRFAVGTAPGVWRPVLPAFVNDAAAWLKDIRPFLVRSSDQFRSKGPLPLTSRAYAREVAEVQSVGSATSTTRTADQTHAAQYWAENPLRTWSRVLRTLSANENVSLVDNARLFAMVYLTGSDALMSVWDDKAHYSFWRPITAIREADTDGNPLTEPDPAWLPLIATPPYPEHPSGHAGLSGSVVATLQDFFGTDRISWTDTTVGDVPWGAKTRSFSRFSQAIEEIINARVWSGIHFRTADEQGEVIGKHVAKWRERHYFKPVRERD